jgi:multiple sugar transport system permease protein
MAYPLIASFLYSFTDFSVLREPVYIGGENYRELAQDEVFWISFKNTLVYAGMAIPIGLVVAIGLALLLNHRVRGITVYRAIFYLPSLVPMIALAVLWLFLFNGERGLVNQLLGGMGITGPNWLGDTFWTKPALALISIWGVGNAVVIYLAGLQSVPDTLYEAADLDGASPWVKTRHVTLPMISPVIQFNLVMGIITALQIFAVPYVMFPNGTPARSTYFYSVYLFDNAFRFQKMGYACAMGWILFLVIFALTMFAIRATEKRVYYGGA